MDSTKIDGIRYAPEDPSLPKPWRELIDGKTGYNYFWNPQTNVTQYQKPVVMDPTEIGGIQYVPEDPSLPKPWRGVIDEKTGCIYFWNPKTNVSQFQKPVASQKKPDSPDKCVSVAISSSVQGQQSSQVPNQDITTIDDDNRNGRGSVGRPELDSGGRSYQGHKSITGKIFSEGTSVEVCFQKEKHDVWHVGTVLKVTGSNTCLVKYQCPGDDNEHKIQEFAYSPDIRPSPPSLEDNDFDLLEKVEAYFEGCWWSGLILRLLVDRRYLVRINHAKKEMRFDHTKLRHRMVWTDGKWMDEARVNFVTTLKDDTEEKDNTGVHVEEVVDKECLTEVDMSVKEVNGARSAKNCEIPLKKDQKKQSRDQEMHTVDSFKGSTEENNSSTRKRGRPEMLSKKHIGEKRTGARMDMKYSCVGNETKSCAENNCVVSTTVDEIPNNGDFQPSSQEKMVVNTSDRKLTSGVRRHDGTLSRTANIPLLKDQEGERVPSKRDNRPNNSVSNGHGEMSKTVDKCREIDHAKDEDMVIGEVGDINDDQPLSKCLNIPPPVGPHDSKSTVIVLEALRVCVQHQCATANGSQDGFRTPPLVQEDTMEPSPLQKTDGPNPGDVPVKKRTPAIVSTDTTESLPFVKCSSLWKNIDSMEIYKKMTQKPHFSPLFKCVEETREGLAIGLMVNFSNLVENTSKLQFSSDIALIERSLKILAEFKSHGFDVEKVQACLTQLLSKKRRAEELQKEYDDIGSEILNTVYEGNLDEELSQLYQKIKEIEKKLDEAKSKKEIKEKSLSALQSKQDAVKESVQRLQLKFDNVVASL